MKLKEAFPSVSALFAAVSAPTVEHGDQIKALIYGRWAPYDLCMDDVDEWTDWFSYLCLQNFTLADKILASTDLIENPLLTHSKTTITDGSQQTTDTTKVVEDSERAHATSGYNNTNATSENNQQTSGNRTTTDNGSTTTNGTTTAKHSDTPQSAVGNLSSGYLSDVTVTDETGTDTSTRTTTDTNSGHTEGEQSSESKSNYLDAMSENGKKTSEHSGGVHTKDDITVTETGYDGNLSELLKSYRETLENLNRQVADMFAEGFCLVFSAYTPGSIWEV